MTFENQMLSTELLESHVEMATGVDSLVPEVRRLAEDPPDNDPALYAFYRVLDKILTQPTADWHHDLREIMDGALNEREKPIPAQVATNTLQRNMQRQALKVDRPNFPGPRYEKDLGWQQLFHQAVEDPYYRLQLKIALKDRTINACLKERFASHKMVGLSEEERIGPEPSFLEIGASTQLGQKWIQSGLPAQYIEVLYSQAGSEDSRRKKQTLIVNPLYTRFINNYLTGHFRLGTNWGVDKVPITKENIEWSYACTTRPNELKDPTRQQEWEQLIEADIKGTNFYNAEFSREGMKDFKKHSGMDHFKLVTIPTMLNQIDPDERQEKIDHAKEYVDPDDGYLLVQDFAMVSLHQPDRLRMFANWHRAWGTYRMFLADPREDFSKFHEIFVFDGGRVRSMMFGRDIGKLAMIGDIAKLTGDNIQNTASYLSTIRDAALDV